MINKDQHVKHIQNNRHELDEYYLRHDGNKTICRHFFPNYHGTKCTCPACTIAAKYKEGE